MLLITSPRFEEHVTPPGHPESMERARVFGQVWAWWRENGGKTEAPRLATREELLRVHDRDYLDRIAASAGRAVMLDADTFTSPESVEIAGLAAGGAIQAGAHALERGEPAFALVRPPGHHAEADKAMGFCIYNNVALAAAAARAGGAARVAIVDIDVHHGNGTQWIFYDDPDVLYLSTHQFPFYPGTGAADEIGTAAGTGFTVNVPVEAGATDADYGLIYRAVIVPVLQQFAPRLTIISAGFDIHADDPLASMRLTTDGCTAIVTAVASAARRAGSALAVVTEGGYDLEALRACLEHAIEAVSTSGEGPGVTGGAEGPAPRGERAVAAVRAVHGARWRLEG
jgi:acetoin utilization deacetylase AcuC-like enzyme